MTEMVAHRPEGLLLIAQSNAGLPVIRGDEFHYDTSPAEMADYARRMRELGRRARGRLLRLDAGAHGRDGRRPQR